MGIEYPFPQRKLVSRHKMHADELDIDTSLVRRLLSEQFPQWAELALDPVHSAGTDNALFRLGHDMVVRLPRIQSAVESVEKEHEWLPRLAPHLPIAIPVPLGKGEPAEGYPWRWSVFPWLEGENPTIDAITNVDALTADLVNFIDTLRRVDLLDGPPARRGGPLLVQDEEARSALAQLTGMIDTDAATVAWNEALKTPRWSGAPVWIHGDLLPGNLLAQAGRLTGVIDWAALGVGDPACDMIVAWALLPPAARETLRVALRVDDATWARGRGWALSIALIQLPYYKETNPELAAIARRVIDEILVDYKLGT